MATVVYFYKVLNNSSCDQCGPNKCSLEMYSCDMVFDMVSDIVSDMVSDNTASDRCGSDNGALL